MGHPAGQCVNGRGGEGATDAAPVHSLLGMSYCRRHRGAVVGAAEAVG